MFKFSDAKPCEVRKVMVIFRDVLMLSTLINTALPRQGSANPAVLATTSLIKVVDVI